MLDTPTRQTVRLLDELTENEIQKSVFQHLRTRGAPGIFAFHPKNGSSDMRGRRAGIHVGLGVVPGIPDIIVVQRSENFAVGHVRCAVFALELKRLSRKGRKLTEHEVDQAKTRCRMGACGVVTGVAYGLDDAIEQLETWGLLRGAAR